MPIRVVGSRNLLPGEGLQWVSRVCFLLCVVVYPHPCLCGGVRSYHFRSTSQLISPSGQQLHHFSRVCPQIQGCQCVAYVGAVEEMMCVVCVLQRGNSGDGCDFAST